MVLQLLPLPPTTTVPPTTTLALQTTQLVLLLPQFSVLLFSTHLILEINYDGLVKSTLLENVGLIWGSKIIRHP